MNEPGLFSARYERRWPRTTAALRELERRCREFQRLRTERGERDPETLDALEAANLADRHCRETERQEAVTVEAACWPERSQT